MEILEKEGIRGDNVRKGYGPKSKGEKNRVTFKVGGFPSKTKTGLMPDASMRMVRLKRP